MAYDELKEHRGRKYTGMKVGGRHHWVYPEGHWKEVKTAPDRWDFTFASSKHRKGRGAPPGSGVKVDTAYHWYVLAHQVVRKVDANTYDTFMEGVKHKLAHKRPGAAWSTGASRERTQQKHLVAILEEALAQAKAEGAPEPLEAIELEAVPKAAPVKPKGKVAARSRVARAKR